VTSPHYLDTLGIGEAAAGLPEQITAALATSADVLAASTLPDLGALRSVAIVGMGASGLAGDVAAAYGAPRAPVPIWAGHHSELPAFVGPYTLVIALSWSGTTGETVSAVAAALEAGAPAVVVTGGGALADLAAASGLTRFTLPPGLPAARTALGAMVVPVLLTLAHIGLIPEATPSLASTAAALARRRDALAASPGPAEEVARLIGRTIPLIYGASGLGAVAARRWKHQINLNAKTPAFCSVQPELSHDEVAGWGQHGDMTRQIFTLITLRQAGEPPAVARQFELANDITDEVMANILSVWAEGDDDLGRFFDHALFGDFVSLHLAGREGIDPGPTPVVDDLRQTTQS
jgi:glucose/mannose-6-phosphate isomerase